MIERLRAIWTRFWWGPETRVNLAAARIIVALTALWIVLSRRDLPSVVTFPREWWHLVLPERQARFFFVFGAGTERLLWAALHVALIAVLFGVAARAASLVAGVLLYHFGALEVVLWTGNPYLRGYSIPSLALLIIAASASAGLFKRRGPGEPSWENRWPLALIQFLFAGIYFWSAYAKLYTSGLQWLRPDNMRMYIAGIDQWLDVPHSKLNVLLMSHPSLLAAMAVAGLCFDALFALVLFSRRARWIILPLAALFHLANGIIFHIWFQNAWLLLIYVDWNSAAAILRRSGAGASSTQPSTQ